MLRNIATGLLALGVPSAAEAATVIDINGGSSWGGWTSVGASNQLGVYGSGSDLVVYDVYKTIFSFDNHSKSGSPTGGGPTGGLTGFGTGTFSSGAFTNGNRILGIGVDTNGGSLSNFTSTLRFDMDADSYQPASSVGGGDGRTSSGTYSEFKDFTVQFAQAGSWAGSSINGQAGDGAFYGGTSNFIQIGNGSNGSDWPFRAFATADSYQMFFDLDAMEDLYGAANPFGFNALFPGIGTFGETVRIALNGLGTNNVVIGASTIPPSVSAIPEPASVLSTAGLLASGLMIRRRKLGRVRG